MDIMIYSTPTCPYCRQAKEYLKGRNIPFTDRNVASDQKAAQEMVERSGQRGVPVLIIDGEIIVGFDRRRIEAALERASAPRPRLGASVADAAQMAPKYGLGITQGAYVGQVNAGSVAERGGIKAQDVIVSLADDDVANANDVQRIVETLSAGQGVPAVVWRDGRQIRLNLQF